MNFLQDLESTLFFFGFQECKKSNLNFLKLEENEYLLMKIFEKVETADLIHAKFNVGGNPCNSKPYWEKSIKLSFSPKSDTQMLKDFVEKYGVRYHT